MKILKTIFVKINFFMRKIKFSLFFVFLLILSSCKKEIIKKDYTLEGFVFGTTYKITYLNASKNYRDSFDSIFKDFNNSLSTYLPDSDISKINRGDSTIIVDNYFKEVFKKSKSIYKETNGFFDPTVGNLVNAYGFGTTNEKKNLSDVEIKNQLQYVGLDMVTLENDRVKKKYPKIYLDFNSIAKGFGIDVIARFLDSEKIDNYLIEIGGEIRAKGEKNNGSSWVIKIVNPVDVNGGYKKINLSNKAMATSGNYRKFRLDSTGKKYVHTINPKTGLAKESNLLSVSVITKKDCADADAYATAFMAMGLEETKKVVRKNKDLEVVLIYFDENENIAEFTNYRY